jgi:Protein of unknown function (DUF2809)
MHFDPMSAFRKNAVATYRLRMLGSAIALVPLGYFIRFHGSAPEWLNDALGSVIYEMFWITLFSGILPKIAPLKIAMTVGLTTSALEFLQLWHPPLLQIARATLPGRLVLGTTFSWLDFPAYLGGSTLGYLWTQLCLPRRPFRLCIRDLWVEIKARL